MLLREIQRIAGNRRGQGGGQKARKFRQVDGGFLQRLPRCGDCDDRSGALRGVACHGGDAGNGQPGGRHNRNGARTYRIQTKRDRPLVGDEARYRITGQLAQRCRVVAGFGGRDKQRSAAAMQDNRHAAA